jgi:hypothetical protein
VIEWDIYSCNIVPHIYTHTFTQHFLTCTCCTLRLYIPIILLTIHILAPYTILAFLFIYYTRILIHILYLDTHILDSHILTYTHSQNGLPEYPHMIYSHNTHTILTQPTLAVYSPSHPHTPHHAHITPNSPQPSPRIPFEVRGA